MSRKSATVLVALLAFGAASVALADPSMSVTSDGRTGALTDATEPFTAKEKASRAASQAAAVRTTPFRRDGVARAAMVWITLTEPGGKRIHINVEQVTSVRSATQIPGARAQLDLASGKFQGVQEDAEHVMRLILAPSDPRENDEIVGVGEMR
jgi:hypothetical protein